jgi:hypothetical protein
MNDPLHSLWASLPAAAFTHLPSAPALLQTWHVLLPPKQALSQQTLSTQWAEPQSESLAHVAPLGFSPLVHSRSAVQKFGASHFVVAFESVPPGRIPVHFPLPDAAQV